ncbi:hypothetical protein V8E36_004244 [Tilletia maclaganii]
MPPKRNSRENATALRAEASARSSSFEGSSASRRSRIQRQPGGTQGQASSSSTTGAAGATNEPVVDEQELNELSPAIVVWHKKLGMTPKYTLLAASCLQEQARNDPYEGMNSGMVSTTMTAFANLERSNTIIDLLQGPRSAAPIQLKAGVVQSIEAINKKLPTLLPMLVMSDKVEERGRKWLRRCTKYAFLSEAVPAYSASYHDIANAVMALAKNKPEELGTNGKHLLKPSNTIGTDAVNKVIKDKVNDLRIAFRKAVAKSMLSDEEEGTEPWTLKELVQVIVGDLPNFEVTLGLVQRVAIWRRTGTLDGCTTSGDEESCNKAFWKNVDRRIMMWLANTEKGKAGDAAAAKTAEEYINNIFDHEQDTYGEFILPSMNVENEVQNEYMEIFANGLPSNVGT